MCGFVGYLHLDKGKTPLSALEEMTRTLVHRGPDSAGTWQSDCGYVGLGHRRLAIQDLSPMGAQPMHSHCGRYTIVYNGEIYNAPEIQRQLSQQGLSFRGHADTEILLEAIAAWGLLKALKAVTGMFAFSLWDHKEKTLHLARDRLGEKPLYYTTPNKKCFLFGSELKALWEHSSWQGRLNTQALGLFFRHAYIPTPHTIFKDVYKLKPGHILTIPLEGPPQEEAYWSFLDLPSQEQQAPQTEADALDTLDALLTRSVKERLISDVPIGAFLSGGIDSSLIAAMMQKQTQAHTFSIGFSDQKYNEADYAKKIAHHLGTTHTELYVTEKDALDIVPTLPTLFDEPFADSSQIPTSLLSKMARQHVTVALSGDGGDELFAGYSRYTLALRLWKKFKPFPHLLKRTIASLTPRLPVERLSADITSDKTKLLRQLLAAPGFSSFYQATISIAPPEDIVPSFREPSPWFSHLSDAPLSHMKMWDTLVYLPDDILTKVDRAAMAYSLETRIPLLDHHLVAFATSLPDSMTYQHGQGKILLKKLLSRYVPQALFDRPKMGFGVPLSAWIDGALNPWAQEMLSLEKLSQTPELDAKVLHKTYQSHKKGQLKSPHLIWSTLVWQQWYDHHKGKAFS